MAYIRPVSQMRIYGTSSKSTNLNTPKDTNINWPKSITDNIMTQIWKSATYLSSFLKPVASLTFQKSPSKNRPISEEIKDLHENSGTQNSQTTSEQLLEEGTSHFSSVKDFAEKQVVTEATFYEWIRQRNVPKKETALSSEGKKKIAKPVFTKTSIEQRSCFLVKSLQRALSSSSHLVRLEEICKHLIAHPQEKDIMFKEGLLRSLLWLRKQSTNREVVEQVQVALTLMGFHDPPKANGIRILSIDGGGTRGIMAIEILRHFEERTSMKIYQLFDYMCGVSSGAILSFMLGGLRMSLDECESLYRKLSAEVFNQSALWGTGRLMWSHAYYDTTVWVNMLKNVFGEKLLVDTARNESSPKIAAISAIMNLSALQAFVFRNYAFPHESQSQYLGSCSYKMWEAIRASGAAPGYFEEYCMDGYLHQDGGIMINNPTALAIHESRLLWPSDKIQCVVSLGSGRYSPLSTTDFTSTSLKMKILKIIDSATDTEGVHIALHDLLSLSTYFRFNPYLKEFLYLDENRPEKLQQLKTDAQMYLRRNEYKFAQAISQLSQPRSNVKKLSDWIQLQKLMLL